MFILNTYIEAHNMINYNFIQLKQRQEVICKKESHKPSKCWHFIKFDYEAFNFPSGRRSSLKRVINKREMKYIINNSKLYSSEKQK